MSTITASLLGQVHIETDGVPVSLPFKQAEALIYYLLTEQEVSRTKIADIIWGDSFDERKVKSSMRNAIYVLRKAFGREFIIEPRKNTLKINPEFTVHLDVSRLKEELPEDISFYRGDFLEDFYLKDNELYNDWITNTRQLYKRMHLEQLRRYINATFQQQRWSECETACRRLISLDEFDESAYRWLIEIYRMQGEYSQAIALYSQLEKLLSEELFQSPCREITDLMETIKQERNHEVLEIIAQKSTLDTTASRPAMPFYGRQPELDAASAALERFLQKNRQAVSLAVVGEAGIGKTTLLEKILRECNRSDALVFHTRCYRAEEDYILKPWHNMFEQLIRCIDPEQEQSPAFRAAVSRIFPFLYGQGGSPIDPDEIATGNYDNSQRGITHALLQLAETQKMIFCFDDVQWADPASISLMRDVLTTGKNRNILFLFGCREEHHAYVASFLEDMKLSRFLQELHLARFGFDDTVRLADLLLPDRFSSGETQKQLYRETEGNPFFIIETVNNIKYNGDLADITPNMRDTIRLRTMFLSPECRNILNLLSLFFDGASFETLLELSNKEEYELIEILETLMSKQLIREEVQPEGVLFQFTHQKILEYVYAELSLTKRRILHGKIALQLENSLKNSSSDVLLYSKLMYHFRLAGDRKKYLRYNIEYVYSYLNRSHEYYPVISSQLPRSYAGGLDIVSADSEGVTRILREITGLVDELRDQLDQEDCQGFLSDYYHMMGRYHIRQVEYKPGYDYISRLIELNQGLDTEQCRINMIKANRQLICIYINRCEIDKMREVVHHSFRILGDQAKPEETAIWMRLAGLCDIMSGMLEEGTAHLRKAISIFETSGEKDKYLFNLAAAYAWLGEVERNRMRYDEALKYYDQAIAICTDNFLTGGIATFYTYAGQAALDGHDLDAAEHYLSEAVSQFNRVELMWGRGTALAYYGLLHLQKGNYQEALSLLERADHCAKQLESPHEYGLLDRVRAQISLQMRKEESRKLREVFGQKLREAPETYLNRARKHLNGVYSPIDQQYLSELEEQLNS